MKRLNNSRSFLKNRLSKYQFSNHKLKKRRKQKIILSQDKVRFRNHPNRSFKVMRSKKFLKVNKTTQIKLRRVKFHCQTLSLIL